MKNYFRNQQPQCVPNQEDKENAGYENFDNANVAASLLMLFHCSAKESRLQELYEFPESALGFNFCLHKNYYNNRLILNKLYLPF
jgi:hypothetical protein